MLPPTRRLQRPSAPQRVATSFYTESVSRSSTDTRDFPLPRTAQRLGFDLLARRTRRKRSLPTGPHRLPKAAVERGQPIACRRSKEAGGRISPQQTRDWPAAVSANPVPTDPSVLGSLNPTPDRPPTLVGHRPTLDHARRDRRRRGTQRQTAGGHDHKREQPRPDPHREMLHRRSRARAPSAGAHSPLVH